MEGVGDEILDPEDRAGARIFAEHDEQERKKSNAAQLRGIATRRADDVTDMLKHGTKFSEAARVQPTGQITSTPGTPAIKAAKELGAPDFVAGVALISVMFIQGTRSVVRRFVKRRERRNGDK